MINYFILYIIINLGLNTIDELYYDENMENKINKETLLKLKNLQFLPKLKVLILII